MSTFFNSKKDSFLSSITRTSLEDPQNEHASRCKFNFSYFDVQDAGQDFSDWTKEQLEKLFASLRDYSRHPLSYWRAQTVKGGHTILSIYPSFPNKTDFLCPTHVPHQAMWGRFRLGSAVRLVGFVVPPVYGDTMNDKTKHRFDCNTFYVVFLDAEHRFFITEKK